MTWTTARNSAPSMTKMPATLKKQSTRKMAEWTGLLRDHAARGRGRRPPRAGRR